MAYFTGPAFSRDVIEQYHSTPSKFTVEESRISGRVGITNEYYQTLGSEERNRETIDIKYVFRKEKDGRQLLIPWEPDLAGLSQEHVARWRPYHVAIPDFVPPDDDPAYTRALDQELHGTFVDEEGLD